MAITLACVAVLVAACDQPPRDDGKPPQAGKTLDPIVTAARLITMPVVTAVDQDAGKAQFESLHKDLLRSMKVADATRPIDREAARVAARRVDGVRSVVWIDRHNLLALVDRNERRTQSTIDDICMQLEPLGDTLAVVVHLQSTVARNGDELETINRNCQLAPGDHAMLQSPRQLDVIPPEVRRAHQAANARAPDVAESQRRANEAMRVLKSSTPEI